MQSENPNQTKEIKIHSMWTSVFFLFLLVDIAITATTAPQLLHSWQGVACGITLLLYIASVLALYMTVIAAARRGISYWNVDFVRRRYGIWLIIAVLNIILIQFDPLSFTGMLWGVIGFAFGYFRFPWNALSSIPLLVIMGFDWEILPQHNTIQD